MERQGTPVASPLSAGGKRLVLTAGLKPVTIGAAVALTAALAAVPVVAVAAEPAPTGAVAAIDGSEAEAPTSGNAGIADGETPADNVKWSLKDGVLTISGKGDMYGKWTRNYTSASAWSGGDTDLKTAAPWVALENEITKVVVEDGVTSIGAYAFSGLEFVTEISLPESLTTIGNSALCEMSSLVTLEIPSKVDSIGSFALTPLRSLTSFTVAADNNTYGADASGALYKFEDANGTYGELIAFPAGKKVDSYSVPSSVSVLAAGAFQGTQVSRVELSNVSSVGSYCFSQSQVHHVPGLNKVTSLGSFAFRGCTTIESVELNCEAVSEQAFTRCTGLRSVKFGGGVKTIGLNSFSESGLVSVTIPDTVTTMGGGAFNACPALKSVEIKASGLNTNTTSWFARSTSLERVTFSGEGKASFGNWAFSGCSSLRVVDLRGASSIEGGYQMLGATDVVVYSTSPITSRYDYYLGTGASAAWVVTNGAPIDEVPADGILPEVKPVDGYSFDGWFDSKGNQVSSPITGGVVTARYYAESGEESGIEWKLDGDTLVISKKDGDNAGIVPSYSNYNKAPWATFAAKVKHLVIDKGVTRVGVNAFRALTSLEDVDVRDKLEETRDSSGGVTSSQAFSGLSLEALKFSGSEFYIPQGLLKGVAKLGLIDCSASKSNTISFGRDNSAYYGLSGAPKGCPILIPNSAKVVNGSANKDVYYAVAGAENELRADSSKSGLESLYADDKVVTWYADSSMTSKVDDLSGAVMNKTYYASVANGAAIEAFVPSELAYGYEEGSLAGTLASSSGSSITNARVLSGDIAEAKLESGVVKVVAKHGLGADNYQGNLLVYTSDGAAHEVNIEFSVAKAKPTVTGINHMATFGNDGYNAAELFKVSTADVGVTYQIVGGTASATLDGSMIRVTKAGTIEVKATTVETANYESAEATATLDVAKAAAFVNVRVDGKDSLEVVGAATVKVAAGFDKGPADGKIAITCDNGDARDNGDGTWSLPNKTASYKFTASFDGDDNYIGASSFATVKVTRKSTGGNGGGTVVPTPSGSAVTLPSATDGGKVSSDRVTAKAGETVTLTVTPDEGHRTSKVRVTDEAGRKVKVAYADGRYTFTMPEGKAAVSVEFKANDARDFADNRADTWFRAAVEEMSAKGVMNGYGDGTYFGVGHVLTRGEFATLLHNWAQPGLGDIEDENETKLADVADGQFYTSAANWAVANGIINGVSNPDGTRSFAPDQPVTLEQMCVIIGNLADRDAASAADTSELSKYVDGTQVSPWAAHHVAWASKVGLFSGSVEQDGLHVRGGEPIMRERVAVVLSNAFKNGILK